MGRGKRGRHSASVWAGANPGARGELGDRAEVTREAAGDGRGPARGGPRPHCALECTRSLVFGTGPG